MEYSMLSKLISALEFGTNLHISVVFLDSNGNKQTQLKFTQKIHSSPVCDAAKVTPQGLAACMRCRNVVLKWARKRKQSFEGYCTKGVYEYCRPVVRNDETVAVVFVGNILTNDEHQYARLRSNFDPALLNTMQSGFLSADCAGIADLVESYVLFLLETYGNTADKSFDPLLENIKGYVEENLRYDFSMEDLATAFNYDEKYLGRLFKAKTGYTVREYCNSIRIEQAKRLLTETKISIADIAGRTGYNNVTYFNRIFKRMTECSPREYRKLARSEVRSVQEKRRVSD